MRNRKGHAAAAGPAGIVGLACLACLAGLGILACSRKDMVDPPSFRPLRESRFFPDGSSARPPVPGTVPFGASASASASAGADAGAGTAHASLDARPPPESKVPIGIETLRKGRQRFEIYCSPCHGRTGEGNGMIVQRGFPAPPSFFSPRLLSAKDAHIYAVITHGFGQMYGYGYRVVPNDRIAIVAYIRALQFSRNASPADAPAAVQSRLRGGGRL